MLRVRALGALEVELNGGVIDSPASQRPWAVFAYLALSPRPVPRGELAAQFWPEVLDQSARASLRSVLWALRRQVGDHLVVDRDRVGLRDDGGLWVDAREFDLLAASAPEEALGLCRGELLEGVEYEWAMSARQRHRERMIELLEQLAQDCERRGEPRQALNFTRRQIERDPFDEEAHRRLISRLDAIGDRAGALRAYRVVSERLRRELSVAPSARTRELIEQLRSETPGPSQARATTIALGLLPLIGRERELEELNGAWQAAVRGSGGAALIQGDAGIGKTRLATELRHRVAADAGHTATCAALDLGGGAPMSLWAELIRELLPVLPAPPADSTWPEDLAVLTSELPAHFAREGARTEAIAPDLQRTRLFEATVALLGWATRERPLLLLFDDIHSADRPSLELAAYVARRLPELPMMMVLTRRGLPHSPDADQLEQALRSRGVLACELGLQPMASEPIAALARRAARLSDADILRVVERAEGNALLAVETARTLARGEDAVPASLRGSARVTLAPLEGGVRLLVELAAVAARPLEPIELDQLSLPAPDEAAARALETGMLIAEDGRIGFRHALLRDAVYEEIAEPRRRGLHQRWARALLAAERAGGIERPAETARQFRLAGCDSDAVPGLARAAARARAVGALNEAVAYLEEVLTIAPERADLWLELGELEAWRVRREQAEVAFQRALALLDRGQPLEVARAWLRRARAYHGPICVPRTVLESCRMAIQLLERCDQPSLAERHEALAAQAWAEAVAGSVEEAERILAQLGNTPVSDLQTYDVGHARALALMRRGSFVNSYAPSIAAGEAIGRAGRPDLAYGCWANAAGAAAAAGELERALEFIDRGFTALADQGLQSLEIHLLAARSFLLTRLGRIDDARAATDSEQRLAEQLARIELVAMASHDRGLVELEAGKYELAVGLLAAALVDGAPISRPLTRLALAEACVLSGMLNQAAAELRATVLEPTRASDFPEALVPRLTRIQGLIAYARHDHTEAVRRLRESIAGWERLLDRARGVESMTAVLADLGRPVVGLVDPEHELERARGALEALQTPAPKGSPSALVP